MDGKTRNIQLLIVASLTLVILSTGCGGTAQMETTTQTEKPVTARTYSNDPIDTGLLLRDTSENIRAITAGDTGVHFSMEKYDSAGGASVYSAGEGDMASAGRITMKVRNRTGSESDIVELIAVGGQTYTRPVSGIWQASSQGLVAPDLDSLVNYLDFARSSRNFGQESLADNHKTYHVQVDVDSTLAIEAAKTRTEDPATLVALEAMKGATITVDLWIGWDDQLVYQQKTVISGTPAAPGSDTTCQYTYWGKPVEITRPCEAC